MGKQHDRWLDWKLRHGLAVRGQTGGKMRPTGIWSGLLYRFWHRRFAKPEPEGPITTQQNVGGSIGPKGDA